jgi:AraC-like DNA-binding protein
MSFLVKIVDKEIKVNTVQYFLKRPFVVMGQEWKRKEILIGEVKCPPYQFIWDCSFFPDMSSLRFYAVVIDESGNRMQTEVAENIVIDRHVELSTLITKALYVKRQIICDGILDEPFWKKVAELQFFPNGNNRIQFATGWDKKNLYIGARIYDTQLYTCYKKTYSPQFLNANPLFKIYYNDFVGIYIDPLNRKTSFTDTTECEIRVSPNGCIKWKREHRIKKTKGISLGKSKCYGTLNNAADEDSVWIIELALPWNIIGIKPKSNYVLGFDIYNVDREDSLLYRITSIWSGGGTQNVHNPSEWANLKLLPKVNKKLIVRSFIYFSVIIVLFVLIILLRNKIIGLPFFDMFNIKVFSRSADVSKKIDVYLESNYHNEKMNLEEISKQLRFSKIYLMKCYKNEKSNSISKKLIQIRINKAKELMEQSKVNMTEVAFAVGFNSLEVFIRNFKRMEGITPSQYNKKRRNI